MKLVSLFILPSVMSNFINCIVLVSISINIINEIQSHGPPLPSPRVMQNESCHVNSIYFFPLLVLFFSALIQLFLVGVCFNLAMIMRIIMDK